ncbi:unnamed protein product [Lactuca saligna]|uniref:Uncharacterized protein n=1 Tax=Lactuca saligna TaxID=75948 RepID=A0AA35YB18_LACSI|nr:unnamed protein product [Lactuca saligna]
MGTLVRKYHIDPKFHPRLSDANYAITKAPEGLVGVYRVFSKFGWHLPTFDFLETVLDYYGLHIDQITHNGFRKVSFSLRHGSVELCDGLPTSIKFWKEEFFYVHASAFFGPMEYGAIADKAVDFALELSAEELLITERLASNFV